MVQDGSSSGQMVRLEPATQNAHAYVPKHSTGPCMDLRAVPGCQDAGPPGPAPHQDPGPPPQRPASSWLFHAPLQWIVFLAESTFFFLYLIWHSGISLPCPGPLLPPRKRSSQLSARQFPLRMLLAGSEGQAAMHQPPDVSPLPSLLLHYPPLQQ